MTPKAQSEISSTVECSKCGAIITVSCSSKYMTLYSSNIPNRTRIVSCPICSTVSRCLYSFEVDEP